MARGKNTRDTERCGEGFRGEHQSDTQVSQDPDVPSTVTHVAPKKHIPASLHFLVLMTGGISNLPGYFQNILDYSVMGLLRGVNRLAMYFENFFGIKGSKGIWRRFPSPTRLRSPLSAPMSLNRCR